MLRDKNGCLEVLRQVLDCPTQRIDSAQGCADNDNTPLHITAVNASSAPSERAASAVSLHPDRLCRSSSHAHSVDAAKKLADGKESPSSAGSTTPVSHQGAIDVIASDGTVTLVGQVFEAEVDQLIAGVTAVTGVTAVENKLEPHRDAAHVSALQGAGPRTLPSSSARWLRWTPTARLIAGATGIALLATSSARNSARGATRIAEPS